MKQIKERLTAAKHPQNAESGFTLIELMVVVVILGLLATVVVINVLPSQDKAMVEKARADVRLLEQAVDLFRMDLLKYPSTDEGLEVLVSLAENNDNADRYRKGGYIRRLPEDPWGSPYQYVYPGEHSVFDIYSLGADGRVGGDELNADIGNWR